jgi:CheY-like chemotaxis protein
MILFVDDEKRVLDSYLQELQMSGLEVSYVSSIDEGLRILEKDRADVELIILDVMMPWGEAFDEEETEQGLRTGLRFYERVRKNNKELPIMIYTNAVEDDLRKKFEQDSKCRFYQKEDLLPFELAETVKEILQETKGE